MTIDHTVAKTLRLNALHTKKQYDLHRDTTLRFKSSDRVLLIRGSVLDGVHPKAKEPTQGPYTVQRVLDYDRYVLTDLHSRRIHNVVHVSRMIPFNTRVSGTSPWMVKGATDGAWPVKSIVGRRLHKVSDKQIGVDGKVWQYCVRWMGLGPEADSWRSRHYLSDVSELLDIYDRKNPFPPEHAATPEPLAARVTDNLVPGGRVGKSFPTRVKPTHSDEVVTPEEVERFNVTSEEIELTNSLHSYPTDSRVEVYWTDKKAWFAGKIMDSWIHKLKGRQVHRITILYDDSRNSQDTHTHNMI